MTALRRALAAGSLSALAIDLWMLAGPSWGLTRDTAPLGAFYDVQGRAFLDGHLAVPASAVGFEGFEVDGATYIYYGPVLAPRCACRCCSSRIASTVGSRSSRCSWRSSSCSWPAAALYERVRRLVRPARRGQPRRAGARLPVRAGARRRQRRPVPGGHAGRLRGDRAVGAALALAAFGAIVAVLERPTVARVLWAGLLATLAVNTRVSVGLGPIVALAALTVAVGAGPAGVARARDRLRGQLRPPGSAAPPLVVALAVATLVPLADLGRGEPGEVRPAVRAAHGQAGRDAPGRQPPRRAGRQRRHDLRAAVRAHHPAGRDAPRRRRRRCAPSRSSGSRRAFRTSSATCASTPCSAASAPRPRCRCCAC